MVCRRTSLTSMSGLWAIVPVLGRCLHSLMHICWRQSINLSTPSSLYAADVFAKPSFKTLCMELYALQNPKFSSSRGGHCLNAVCSRVGTTSNESWCQAASNARQGLFTFSEIATWYNSGHWFSCFSTSPYRSARTYTQNNFPGIGFTSRIQQTLSACLVGKVIFRKYSTQTTLVELPKVAPMHSFAGSTTPNRWDSFQLTKVAERASKVSQSLQKRRKWASHKTIRKIEKNP